MRRVAPIVVLALVLSACGNDEAAERTTPTGTAPTRTAPSLAPTAQPADSTPVELAVYFLRDGKVAAARRVVPPTQAVARAALGALAEGPTELEREAGLTTAVPSDLTIESLAVASGTATVQLAGDVCPGWAQIVYTLTQFPTIERVSGHCEHENATRSNLESLTPSIFVETPTVGQEVTTPLRIAGTANTFEANFAVNIVDWDGRIIEERFVTATSGSGHRGTFDVTIPFELSGERVTLIVFEPSAEDGRPLHVVEIPLRLAR